MTDRKKRKLSLEILGDLAISLAVALLFYGFLIFCALSVAQNYIFAHKIGLSETDYDFLLSSVLNIGMIVAVALFVLLFLVLLGRRLSYIAKIMNGIEALRSEGSCEIEIHGNNELTDLARAVNYVSVTQKRVREEEKALEKEKEELIRSLSHDIRTPLTSIMAYSELLTEKNDLTEEERRGCFALIRRKSEQIKELTDILLDGGKRSIEQFDDARLLISQLADEFESSLEDDFEVNVSLDCPAFPARFDVRELQRVFDNLISNIRKYADRSAPVALAIGLSGKALVIEQGNKITPAPDADESHGMGILSIRRIAGLYGGRADTSETDGYFSIKIIFTDFS